jgi:hypothetical protein
VQRENKNNLSFNRKMKVEVRRMASFPRRVGTKKYRDVPG